MINSISNRIQINYLNFWLIAVYKYIFFVKKEYLLLKYKYLKRNYDFQKINEILIGFYGFNNLGNLFSESSICLIIKYF